MDYIVVSRCIRRYLNKFIIKFTYLLLATNKKNKKRNPIHKFIFDEVLISEEKDE